MSVIILLVIVGVVVAGLFLLGFIWAVRSGQYDDMYSPSVRILFDNDSPASDTSTETSGNKKESDTQSDKNKSNQ